MKPRGGLAGATVLPGLQRPGDEASTHADSDMACRLASWLADVSADAALKATSRRTAAQRPRTSE
jgi:hypothetical protein